MFTLAEKEQTHRYHLDFGGIFERSTVVLNGQTLGGNNYGYFSFRLDATEAIHSGENPLEITVDNSLSPSDRWYSGCGIYRTVKLLETEAVFLDERDVIVTTSTQGELLDLCDEMGFLVYSEPFDKWTSGLERRADSHQSRETPMFHVLKSYWNPEPMVHFSVMDYSLPDENIKAHWDTPLYADHWHFPQFGQVVIPYMIASNCGEVRLFLNGKQFFIDPSSAFPNRLITGFIPWIQGMVHVVGLMGGAAICEQTLITPKAPSKLAFDKTFSSVPSEKGYELLLTVRVLDEDGNLCFRVNNEVTFAIARNAEILAADNGCLMTSEPYHADHVRLYQGAASVQIRLCGKSDAIMVTATAENLASAETVILLEP